MFWFNHPKPASRRKETAVLAQHPSIGPIALARDPSDADATALPAPSLATIAPLHFPVRYALSEYVSFMWQHTGYLIRRRRIGRAARWYLQLRSTLAAALHFVLQGRSSRVYHFTIDEYGVLRSSTAGVTILGWSDVKCIRRYTRGYLLVLKHGTLPIPFRCLKRGQAEQLDCFATALKAAR